MASKEKQNIYFWYSKMWSTVAEGMQWKWEIAAAIEWQRGVNNVYVKKMCLTAEIFRGEMPGLQ